MISYLKKLDQVSLKMKLGIYYHLIRNIMAHQI